MSPKIFLFDIETAPLEAFVWSLWKQNIGVSQIRKDWYLLTWAGKWLGEETVEYDSNHLHGNAQDDYNAVVSLWHKLDEADIVVAHNGNRFDIKKINARFLCHDLPPPSPYRKVDTLIEARKHFGFASNRLDGLGELLGLGRKEKTDFDLWARCVGGDTKAFEEMINYNVQDIKLLEDVYLAMRPWMQNHPNLGVYTEEEQAKCPKCGSGHIHWRGTVTTQASKYSRFQCQDCGGWGRARVSHLTKEARSFLTMNVAGA